jgi:hypothetical protein
MSSAKQHKKVLLSGNEDCSVVFCPTCDILEVNVGSLTLRLNSAGMRHLNATLNKAGSELARFKTERVIPFSSKLGEVH